MKEITPDQHNIIKDNIDILDLLKRAEFIKEVVRSHKLFAKQFVKSFIDNLEEESDENPAAKLLEIKPDNCKEPGTTENKLLILLLGGWVAYGVVLHLVTLGKRLGFDGLWLHSITRARSVESSLYVTPEQGVSLMFPKCVGSTMQYSVTVEDIDKEELSKGQYEPWQKEKLVSGCFFYHWGEHCHQPQRVCILPLESSQRPLCMTKELTANSFIQESLTPDKLYTVLSWQEGQPFTKISGCVPTSLLYCHTELSLDLYKGELKVEQANRLLEVLVSERAKV